MVESLEYNDTFVRHRGRSTEIILSGSNGKEYRIRPWLWTPDYRGNDGRAEFLRLLQASSSATVWHSYNTDREGNYFVEGLRVFDVELDPMRGVEFDVQNRRWLFGLIATFAIMGVWSVFRAFRTL